MKIKRVSADLETQKRLQIALMLLELPDYKAAIDQLEKIIQIDAENPTVNLILANTFIEVFEYKKAIPILNKVLAQQPDDQQALYSLGQAYAWAGMHQQARPILEKLSNNDPANPELLDTLWHTYIEIEELQLADDIFQRLIQVAPDEFAIYEVMHYECLGKKYYDQAIQVAQYMAEKRPIATYLNILGETLLQAGKPEQAILQFEQALLDDEEFEPAWAYLAQAYRVQNQPLKALQTAEQGLMKCPDSLDIQEQKAIALMELEKYEESLTLIKKMVGQMDKADLDRLEEILLLQFIILQISYDARSACQKSLELIKANAEFINGNSAKFDLLLLLITDFFQNHRAYQEIIKVMESIPVKDLAGLDIQSGRYYLALVALNRLDEAGNFLQELAAHSEIEIELKIKILDLIEQLAQETLAADQPETLQIVLQQIRELNFLPEAARWQPPA